MSPTTAASGVRLDWDMDTFTCPGKVFLFGEYAVLGRAGAMVAAVGPRFQLTAKAVPGFEAFGFGGEPQNAAFHPQSPVSRLMDWAHNNGLPDFRLEFTDPHSGQGGFGASTAQFAMAYRALAQAAGWQLDWKRVWHLYRELTGGAKAERYPPSGADLIAQWIGGVVLIGSEFRDVESLGSGFDWSRLLVFSAASQEGRKVNTHEHLAKLEGMDQDLTSPDAPLVRELQGIVDAGAWAVRNHAVKEFGDALAVYGDALARAGLELEATRADREALAKLPGVLGTKGAGAMQADAVVVAMEPDFSKAGQKRLDVIAAAADRNLRLVADGLDPQAGVACLS